MDPDQEELYAAALLMQNLALFMEDEDELERELLAEEEDDFMDDDTIDILLNRSAGLYALADSLSGPGSRGPYDQIGKVPEYFQTALGWPDREFRHSFRCAYLLFFT